MGPSLISQKRYDEAEQILGGAGAGAQTPYAGGTIAEDLHNPLNLKKVGATGGGREAFEFFASDEDGFRGAARQLALYQNKYGLKTPRQMVERWAPASDNNNHKTYFRNMAAAGLTNPDAPIDVNNKRQMAALLKAMATAEGPLGKRYSVDQIEGFLADNGGVARRAQGQARPKPATTLTAERTAAFANRIAALRKRDQAEARAAIEPAIKNYLAQCDEGAIGDIPVSKEQLQAAFGEEAAAISQNLLSAQSFAIAINQLGDLSAPEQNAFLASRKPQAGDPDFAEKNKRYGRLNTAVTAIRKAWENDPVAWLNSHDGQVAKARAAFAGNPAPESFEALRVAITAAKAQRGIANPAIISAEDSKNIAAELAASPNPAESLKSYQALFGRSFPAIMASVMPNAPNRVNILANDVPAKTVKLVMAAASDKDFEKKAESALGLRGVSKTDFDELLNTELANFASTLTAAGKMDMANELFATTRLCALQYMATQGLSAREAATRAASEIILDRYEVVANRNSPTRYRIPKSLPYELVEKGANAWLDNVDMSRLELALNPQRDEKMERKALENFIRDNGRWITNGNETGLQLFVGSYPAQFADGSDVLVPWEELASLGQDIWQKARDAYDEAVED